MNTKSKQILTLSIILMVSIIINFGMAVHIGYCHHKTPNTIVKTEIKFDTIIDFKYNTDTVYVKENETKYKTIIVNDTTYIEDRGHDYNFSNDVYTLSANAVKLNWYNLEIHKKDTVQFTKQVEIPIYVKPKKSHFYYGVGIGYGYGITSKKFDVYAGFNVGFKF